ncbi:MEGF6-like protein [Mya arenaria]|uniref:MEGF6-like protein n=1 Tax=Mya arenaria TaxID=6604 RepID=A0ABY7DBF4_MYAAR|nr:MEGF6-like protein [Mya arenaria]
MRGIVLIILLLALIHSCRTCTEHQPYSCSEQKTVTEVTVGWCWKFWLLFRCKEEHETTKTVSSTCHRSVCCDGYSRESSSGKCKAVCFGSYTCPNGGSCVAPNQCVCPSGYVRPKCEDENECSDKNGGCTHICVNTKGSHHCSCPPGFILDSIQLTCKDVKECSVNNGGCAHTCVNTEGSHYCSCHPGFSLNSDQLTCRDHNECSVKNGGCSHTCNNTEGAHHCSCPPGFTLDSDQLTCKAEATTATTPQVTTPADCGNENGGCSHSCIGMNETVQCTCPFLKKLADDNVTCIGVSGVVADRVETNGRLLMNRNYL